MKQSSRNKKKVAASAASSVPLPPRVGTATGRNGRVFCECLASVHALLTNCLNCGKIICALEGVGPCPECASHVESAAQQMLLLSSSSSSASNAHSLSAELQRDRLLQYQRDSAQRSHVHDIASDFDHHADTGNKWLSTDERLAAASRAKEIDAKEELSRRTRIIALDIGKRKIVRVLDREETPPVSVPVPNADQGTTSYGSDSNKQQQQQQQQPSDSGGRIYLNHSLTAAPVYVAPADPDADINPERKGRKQKGRNTKV